MEIKVKAVYFYIVSGIQNRYNLIGQHVPLFYHDTLLWALYTNLKDKIDDLDKIVLNYAHILNEPSIYDQGGLHDILFLLKSLDLDMRMGYQLGTTFGYDMKNELKDYVYRPES